MRSLLATLVLLTFLPAQEWARYRGPDGLGTGRAPDLPAAFTDAHVRFRVKVGGKGHSSPILWGDHLYLTREGAAAGERAVVCFDAHTGDELWATTRSYQPYRIHRFNSYASSSVVADERGVYLAWASGEQLVALALDHDGEVRWQRAVGPHRTQHGGGGTPVLHGGVLVVGNESQADSAVLGLDPATGETVWTLPRNATKDRSAYAVPVTYRPQGGPPLLLFASTGHGLAAVDPLTGALVWELGLGFAQRCVGQPGLWQDALVVFAGAGGAGREGAVLRLPPGAGDTAPPAVVARLRRNIPYVPSAVAIDGRFYLFADGGIVSCLDAASGEVLWKQRMEATFFGSPVTNGEHLWIADRDGVLFTLAAGDAFAQVGRFELGALTYSTPALAHGRLYVRTVDELFCFAAAGGAQ